SGGHGHQTYLEVVQNSCNPGFVNLGTKLGKEKLFTYIDDFGFGTKTGIDLQGEGNGILFDPKTIGPLELGTTSFGQGVSVTPIQQVMAVAAVVNGGFLYEPYFAKEWIDPKTGQTVEKHEPKMKKRVVSADTSKEVRQALESVVAKGTGRSAYVDGYRVGGKTGTAQKVGPDGQYMENNYILSFIGFAPADDPDIVVYVAIDNPKASEQFGGVVAVALGGAVIEDSLRGVGGKTGEAQKVGPDGKYMENNYILSFIGFAPADDPDIVVYVAIDNPKASAQFGGVVAAPIVGTIIEDSLREMGVEPTDDGLAKEYQWPEEPKISVPDLTGLHKAELNEYMTNL